jgi:hypothetical protein
LQFFSIEILLKMPEKLIPYEILLYFNILSQCELSILDKLKKRSKIGSFSIEN